MVICLTRFLSFWGGGYPSSGEDPLAGDQNDHDMDSIAGVLKLYFRGLEQPLFPKDIFHDLIACVSEYHYPHRWQHDTWKFPSACFIISFSVKFFFISTSEFCFFISTVFSLVGRKKRMI